MKLFPLIVAIIVALLTPEAQAQFRHKNRGSSCYNGNCAVPLAVAPVAAASVGVSASVSSGFIPAAVDNSITNSYTYNLSYSQLPAAQGSSLLGYPNMNLSADIYSNIDLAAQLNDLTRTASQMSSDANNVLKGVGDQVGRLADNQKEIAKASIQSNALVASILANAQNTQAQANLATALRVPDSAPAPAAAQPAAPGNQGANQAAPADNLQQIQTLFNTKCVSCHKADKNLGGLDLTDIAKLDHAKCDKILNRVTTDDLDKRMPRTADGKPGEKLSVPELKLLFNSAQY